MGFSAHGTDLEPRMIDYSAANIEWLRARHPHLGQLYLETGDATTLRWQHPISAVACETYLGRPLSSWPAPETLREIMSTCNLIIEKFLQNIAGQIPSGTRLCLALPAWRTPKGVLYRLPLLDRLADLRYNAISFEHVREDELVYFRPDQLVARQLLVITRK
jgi:tRNA G10  N-methylase Trm11